MSGAAIVAGRLHAVVRAQGFVAHRPVLARLKLLTADAKLAGLAPAGLDRLVDLLQNGGA